MAAAKKAGTMGLDVGKLATRIASSVRAGNTDVVKAAASAAKKVHLRYITSDSGGDLSLSGVNRRRGRAGGVKVGASYRVQQRSKGPEAFIKATGPLHIINNPTTGHVIRSSWVVGGGRGGLAGPFIGVQSFRRVRGGEEGKRPVIKIPGVGWRTSARHPGTRGKKTWQKGRRAAEPGIRNTMRKNTLTILRKAAKP